MSRPARRHWRPDGPVDSYARLIPFLWPYRKTLLVSTLFGSLVAILWSANLSVAYPLVQVLLRDSNLQEHVEARIAEYEEQVANWDAIQSRLEREINDLRAQGKKDSDAELAGRLSSQVRANRKRNDAASGLWKMQWVQYYIIPWVPEDKFQTFAVIMGLLLIATLLKGLFIFLQDIMVGRVIQLAVMRIRKQALRRTLFLDYPKLAAHGSPDLMSRFTFDTEQMALGMNMISGRLVREPLKCVACLLMALWINWRLTLLSMLFAPLMGVFFLKYGRSVKKASRRMTESMSRLYRILEETFNGLKVVVAFGTASRHRTAFHYEYKEYLSKTLRLVRIDSIAKPTTEVLVMLALFVALLPAAYLVLTGRSEIWGIQLASDIVELPDMAVLYAMLAGMLDPCRKMSNVYSRLRKSAVSIDRVFELMEEKPSICDPADPIDLPRLSHSIVFDNIDFSYPSLPGSPHRGPVLRNLSLKIQAGEVVAIVGQNGSGKSTLMNLLPRFYDVDAGEIRFDGIPIRNVRLADLRRQMGIVTQETVLFEGSVLENILYGAPHATENDAHLAAERAYVTPILETLPDGIHSRIGERGKELSGGQRQRLALARAFVRDPSLLILDEATSAADNESEKLIHDALKSFSEGRTVLMITHSMKSSLLDLITRIVVIDDGAVIATGQHEELLRTCPLYRRLFQTTEESRTAA